MRKPGAGPFQRQGAASVTDSGEKLQKVLAGLGLGSRREVEDWIRQGRVAVNRRVAALGARVTARDQVSVDGKRVLMPVRSSKKTRLLLYNKPVGEVCTRSDPAGRPTVFEKLPSLRGQRWVSVGRLDCNTAGLLLFTNNGELAHSLTHPSAELEREYAVRVFGQVTQESIDQLRQGVQLDDGMASFECLEQIGGEGGNQWFKVVVREGRNRLVRRLWESQGLQVSRLIRMAYAGVTLPRGLRRGRWLEIESSRVEQVLGDKTTTGRRPTRQSGKQAERQPGRRPGRAGKNTAKRK